MALRPVFRIKARDAWKHIPIVMMTAADELSKKLAAFEAGAVDFLTKPIQPEEVLARVRTHLHIRELQAQLENMNRSLTQKNQDWRRKSNFGSTPRNNWKHRSNKRC